MIVASCATVSVAGRQDVGGLVGGNSSLIASSYATGHVTADENVVGLVGFNDASIAGVVWDTETSGIATGVGWGNSAGVTGMTSAELQAAAGYDGAVMFPAMTEGVFDIWLMRRGPTTSGIPGILASIPC